MSILAHDSLRAPKRFAHTRLTATLVYLYEALATTLSQWNRMNHGEHGGHRGEDCSVISVVIFLATKRTI
jgi:hypothetical protein